MAFIAASTGVEEIPAALSRSIDRVLVAVDETIKGRIERNQSAFVGRNRAQEIRSTDRAAEYSAERLLVLADAYDAGNRGVQIRLAHLDRIDDRQRRLILQCLCPTIPELRLIVECVQNRRRISLSKAAVNTC